MEADTESVHLPSDGDPLSDVLEAVRLRGAVFFLWEPGWPYATTVTDGRRFAPMIVPGADQIISYHIVTEGPCWGAVSGEEPVRLETGDILLIPRGDAYVISDRPCPVTTGQDADSIEFFNQMAAGTIPSVIADGGPGPGGNAFICGFLGCSLHPFNPLLNTLPRLIRLPAMVGCQDPLSSLIEFALTESRLSRGGERALLLRLSELMFVEVLRRYLRTKSEESTVGWLGGLKDPMVGKALSILHQRLVEPWTLEALAGEVGASRSVLAERFTRLVGEPPMHYLTLWRMQVAARQLMEHRAKVYAVARGVGYESEAAFSKAFKRTVGMTPAAWRERSGLVSGS
ncbi:AraC family transcriptional regulator [Saccharospirillum salsuginis]|uniref:Cupin n=1 Tax=Saccharospirillum salsuginis TaxID=418750 RepID=A0A918K203_9GAMM|nr:AraC family transcriptional regulator [Saccharospirillum salsuginis]GGX40829.1 cupin [Saccharospirillum salsuginis]